MKKIGFSYKFQDLDLTIFLLQMVAQVAEEEKQFLFFFLPISRW